jgi:molecular chaperone DnaK (HSP70)
MEPIVGIDLGTTNSEIAFILDGNAIVLMDNDNGILPSVVGLDANGKIIVGHEALNQAILSPDRTVQSVKRLMGSGQAIQMGDAVYQPQEISACILKSLKERAEKTLQQPVNKAVITVPAYFTDSQRQATREAGEIAGLTVVRIINEPTAAALAYESRNSETQTILVYDLGGGTFDVSIVRIENGIVEVLSSTGDNHLGGDDFDQLIVELLSAYIQEDLKLNTIDNNPVLKARLRRAAEKAKIALSFAPYIRIEEDHIGKKLLRDIHLSYELSRNDFEELIQNDLDRTMESVIKALNDARLLPSAIDKIILVGGSTRIPRITEMLTEKFGKLPHGEIDPDMCVALGASIQAGREMGLDSSCVLLDITPYSFGTSALGELNGKISSDMFVPLIRRNTKLPTSRSEAFFTLCDNQKQVEIRIFQGEDPDASLNIELGKYLFQLTPAPEGSPIVLNFDLDLNGILKIQATEKITGNKINAVIENAINRFSDSEISDFRDRVNNLWQPDANQFEQSRSDNASADTVPPDIQQILDRARAKLEDAAPEDREEMINLMEDIQDAVQNNQLEKARSFSKEMDDILLYIG